MGLPMAKNLARSGARLAVWNRSSERARLLESPLVEILRSPGDVFKACRVVILMLANSEAMDEVLQRGEVEFAEMVRGRIVVNMGTTSPEYSAGLDEAIRECGGQYVEAPVSGSRAPAEAGQLVAMLAGNTPAVDEVALLLKPMCKQAIVCGAVPSALLMKLSVNLFLITMVTGLCESFHFAERNGLDLEKFGEILDAGPMASAVSKMKLAKLIGQDFSVQASIVDVQKNSRLIVEAARSAAIATRVMDDCNDLFSEALEGGLGQLDMVGVLKAMEVRTDRPR
ncbi:2-hydroxy-3-oxopropionate reductase [Rhizobacter sp. Root404]|nr:2-hydroxy-3-oxopropionate reductase [Rhizobacter sp. Root404]